MFYFLWLANLESVINAVLVITVVLDLVLDLDLVHMIVIPDVEIVLVLALALETMKDVEIALVPVLEIMTDVETILALALALALASLYIDNTKPICYNIAKKNSHVVLISVSEVFIWQTAKTETSLLTALWAL